MKYKEIYGYKVSSCGTVLSKHGKPRKPSENGRGYLILNLRVDGKLISKALHRLVAEAWVPNPEGHPEVDHKDGDKKNNHYKNLRWVTRGENIAHAYRLKKRSAVGTSNARCKTTEDVVRKICRLLEAGKSAAEIRDRGFSYNLVRSIKARKNWKHISKSYKF